MRSHLIYTVTPALVFCVALAAQAVTLSNPGFETPASGNPDGWGVVGTVDVEDVSTDFALSGSQSLKFSATVLGQTAQLFTVAVTPGDDTTPLTWSVEAFKPSGDAITNHFLVLGVEFKAYNTPGDPGSGDHGVGYFEQIFETNSLPTDAWTTVSTTQTAGSAWDLVLLHIKLVGLEASSSGSLYLDDAAATLGPVPEPATIGLALVGVVCCALRRRAA